MDQCIAFSERDWPHESLRGMYCHRACKQCGKQYIGPKRAVFCFICEKDKKVIDNGKIVSSIHLTKTKWFCSLVG